MSLSQEISQLAEYIPESKYILLERAIVILESHEPELAAEALELVLNEIYFDKEVVLDKANILERALAKYHRPILSQTTAFKTDLKRFFQYIRGFVENEDRDAALAIMEYYHDLFDPRGKQRCGTPIGRCRNELDGGECKTLYGNVNVLYCPKCNTPRRLCKNTPTDVGRCRYHGGNMLTGPLKEGGKAMGRVKVYGEALSGRLQEMYVEAITDPDYLSVAPEISALAVRNAELMSQTNDTDYMVISTGIEQALAEIERGLAERNNGRVHEATVEIRLLLEKASDNYRRWDEIGKISSRLGRLAEAERKRIVEAQQTISVQEMYMIRQQMLVSIRDAASAVSNFIYKMINAGRIDAISPVTIRNKFLMEMQAQLGGKKSPQLVEVNDYDEEE